ncbi:hypothetical protein KAK06_05650 [Ideonella sp. 4Y11]|uniref:Glycosyl hydrolase family 32 N-terminal domain-containing protein n=1 Tax=Ideonella aquatica TaxID=2824119 RepID=A0A941BIC5_9BURK|nr:hypothetical protein [Ideonella aquatica]MBQ0958437.1 hypothetical protein [Ideonella aquatica]
MSALYRPDQPQAWRKLGRVYAPSGAHGFDASHCHKPTPLLIDPQTIRVYFGTRDERGRTRTSFVDVSADDPTRVLYVHDRPVLDLGTLGAFDDSGANVSCVLRVGTRVYMYFIGWNPSTTVHTRNAIGLAISEDGGTTFQRAFDGAVLDRTRSEPFYTGAVDVLHTPQGFRLWYTSGSAWKVIKGKPEIFYHVKYGHSVDGIDWLREDITCIPPAHEWEATARPSVLFDEGRWRMWYSRRDLRAFRTDPRQGYRAGYAESDDGQHWTRLDERVGLACDADEQAWDGQAVAYPYVLNLGERQLLFYNGNGFGRTGFGVAERRR